MGLSSVTRWPRKIFGLSTFRPWINELAKASVLCAILRYSLVLEPPGRVSKFPLLLMLGPPALALAPPIDIWPLIGSLRGLGGPYGVKEGEKYVFN